MNLLERVLTLLRANLNSVVEKSDDPEKTLRQLQLDMRNQLVQVKTEIARAIAESHVLQKRGMAKKAEADTWLMKAEQAVHQGHDDIARNALVHYNDLNKMTQRYQQQKKEQEQLVTTMRSVLQKLESKISEVDTTIELIATRKRNALIQQRVYEALNKANSKQGKTEKACDTILNAEARAQALAEIHNRDVDQQLDTISTEQDIEQQLQNIKNQRTSRPRNSIQSTRPTIQRQTGPLHDSFTVQGTSTAGTPAAKSSVPFAQLVEEASTDRDLDLEYLKQLLEVSESSDEH